MVLLGAWLRRREVLDTGPVSRLTLYALTPALIFSGLAGSRLPAGQFARIAAGVIVLMGLLYAIGAVMCRMARVPERTRASYLLGVASMNAGNYGLPIVLFAFGEDGFALAVLFFTAQSLITNTVGVYVASRGRSRPREALRNALGIPVMYAAALALPFPLLGARPPEAVMEVTTLLGRAAIPLLLLVLGAQLAMRPALVCGSLAWSAIATRLLISPALGAAVAWGLGLEGESLAVFIVESGMPTAVLTLVLAVEFEADSEFLAGVIAVSTLLSLVTLPVLLALVTP